MLHTVSRTVSTKQHQTKEDAEVKEAVLHAEREEEQVDKQDILLP